MSLGGNELQQKNNQNVKNILPFDYITVNFELYSPTPIIPEVSDSGISMDILRSMHDDRTTQDRIGLILFIEHIGWQSA